MATARTAKSALIRLFDQIDRPIYVLDERRSIIYANAACCRWLEMTLEEVTSLTCNYHSSQDVDRNELIASALCPPLQARSSENEVCESSYDSMIELPTGNASRQSVLVHFEFLKDESSNFSGTFAIVDLDRTELSPEEFSSIDSRQLHQQLQQQRAERYGQVNLQRWVGASSAAKQLAKKIDSAIRARTNTLITGPRGSGKEFLANVIHAKQIGDSDSKLVSVDCRVADAETIQDSIRYLGRFAAPDSNHILLTNIELLSQLAQQELLGFLEMPSFQLNVFSTTSHPISNKEFKPQLLNYLSGIQIDLPALRDRIEDIPFFAQLFLEALNDSEKNQIDGFSDEAINALLLHDWPGNLNELYDTIRLACENTSNHQIRLENLPRDLKLALSAHATAPPESKSVHLEKTLHDVERSLIENALRNAKHNKAEAARQLGISRNKLLRRLDFFKSLDSDSTDGIDWKTVDE